jgi:hypothetical protein
VCVEIYISKIRSRRSEEYHDGYNEGGGVARVRKSLKAVKVLSSAFIFAAQSIISTIAFYDTRRVIKQINE